MEAGDKAEDMDASEITLTLVRAGKPVKLMKSLKKSGISIDSKLSGIYHLYNSKLLFDTQIIVTDELEESEYIWLSALSDKIRRSTAEKLLTGTGRIHSGTWEQDAAESVLKISISANKAIFNNIKKEDPAMYDALKELMRPEIEEAREDGIEQGLEEGRKEGIRDTFRENVNSLIKNGVSMDILYKSFGKEAVDNVVREGK